jgi:predicted XRE-type DNA-binding protein
MMKLQTSDTTMEQDLIVAKLRWEQARATYQDALGQMNGLIADAAADGMSQSDVARVLGWPRQRVSKLLADLAADTSG